MRVTGVFRPADYPGTPDAATAADLTTLFAYLCPGADEPAIDQGHAGIAAAALNPRLALLLAQLSRFIALETGWARRTALRELAILTVNHHYGSDFSIRARTGAAEAAGIGADRVAALADWRTSPLFDEEQRLVIAYTQAVVAGDVPASLFARMVETYGETGAVECTSLIGFWSFWAMLLNAVQPAFDDPA